jgi:hypothetical protein
MYYPSLFDQCLSMSSTEQEKLSLSDSHIFSWVAHIVDQIQKNQTLKTMQISAHFDLIGSNQQITAELHSLPIPTEYKYSQFHSNLS